ncbi:MAG: hypothetical protein FWF92_08695 [Oscillospiraceae bacterium]|nr:hypothetical protein [Oscillospiraceae bacterium]
MNKEYFADNISDEVLAKITDKMLNFEKTQKNKNIKASIIKLVSAAAVIALVIGLINILPVFINMNNIGSGVGSEGVGEPDVNIYLPAEPTEETEESTDEVDLYAHVRFGETRDILLLDVEWYTYDTFLKYMEEYNMMSDDTLNEMLNKIEEKSLYVSKSVNGKSILPLIDAAIYVNDTPKNENPEGYYEIKIYPWPVKITYIDKYYDAQTKDFGYANSKQEYDSILENEIIPYCDELLEEGLLTQELYDYYTMFDPLDYCVDLYF